MKVGVIGLGAMGLGMAASLRRAGFAVHACDVRAPVHDASRRKAASRARRPRRSSAACDVVISVVVNAAQTEEVLFGANGAV